MIAEQFGTIYAVALSLAEAEEDQLPLQNGVRLVATRILREALAAGMGLSALIAEAERRWQCPDEEEANDAIEAITIHREIHVDHERGKQLFMLLTGDDTTAERAEVVNAYATALAVVMAFAQVETGDADTYIARARARVSAPSTR
ncbi:hypothetical protein [Marinactinospora rubrisoli]|uniref:Uncharacterized protein n=1 Tax=Marinactinospora rubrisoli TaxID=2715399 RepID=A0ABW2KQT9_9ACTN